MMFIELAFVFFSSLTALFLFRKLAKKIGLVDTPNERKLHQGAIPLVGGISICLTLVQFLYYNPDLLNDSGLYAICIIILTVIGAIDDKVDLSFKVRLLVQGGLSICMIYFAGLELHTLGNMFAVGDVNLGSMGYVVTILAVIGAINAFNMVDGIDGLLGGLAIVTFGGLGVMLTIDGQSHLAFICMVIIAAIVPYVLLNLGFFGRKRRVFMGDAGSMLIGFTVIWLLLLASQNGTKPPLRPVTALWLIAVPLMDMAAIMMRRIRRGDSPFKPDREHLHHIFQRLGLSSHQTLGAICLIGCCYAGFGIYGEVANIPEYVMFVLFILCFIVYSLLLNYVWRISSWIRERYNIN
ncbi:UDP-N-acetylglucosamine--undecaprenyl-phosphate N-acetylglucosaminephosphotransferase [Photobacterium damselae subsp. damselae]|uniref:UDP-N-acetylglucosamine--undecaprenyl-phosphate N-acetylglucosaminephosphotransferase n=1 Tax=Photobacterium damselae TaxID=38293 RepID=UPI001EEE7BBF|nr:UDP-N-acetylglucosamine--undecaprenyl-phosphate N-acetylglucosaminephosphotransferase [Photobacterium damselae]UJZ94556.1 UDP-N-acetylglucosamine--undecaprenyl-phosphate N-acetylglucosaminephosphotransferase [Photobacterium damselae subsp. damselae]UJZ98539.1 UDP-N-acetylglucosamine--undecaprenyl-phosphate N-acetylglucosaminephosphotransferase [Photobacterium damselae subsp. damselae]